MDTSVPARHAGRAAAEHRSRQPVCGSGAAHAGGRGSGHHYGLRPEFHQPVQPGFGQNHLSLQPWRAEHACDGDDAARPAIAAAVRRHAGRATGAADPATAAQAAPAPETTPSNVTDVTPPPAPDQPVTVNYFYNTLAPYGSWVVVGGYGRCWRPTVCVYNSSWQPYCDNGHWVYSDCGWYWASSYAWGATFHYGRWFRDASFGWCWYPDTVWAPSWVTWRYSNNYCGWAPLPPHTAYQAGVGIVYNGGNVSVGFGFGLGASCFTFVPTAVFLQPASAQLLRCAGAGDANLQQHDRHQQLQRQQPHHRQPRHRGGKHRRRQPHNHPSRAGSPDQQCTVVQGRQSQRSTIPAIMFRRRLSGQYARFAVRRCERRKAILNAAANAARRQWPRRLAQYSAPAANYHSRRPHRLTPKPVTGVEPGQCQTAHWQPAGTPRNVTPIRHKIITIHPPLPPRNRRLRPVPHRPASRRRADISNKAAITMGTTETKTMPGH